MQHCAFKHWGCSKSLLWLSSRCRWTVHHVAATLFALDSYCKERQNNVESCTSKPCKWNIPRKRKGPVTPIVEMSFEKHDYNKPNKVKRRLNIKPTQDVRAVHQREWAPEKVNNMLVKIKAYQSKTGNVVGWSNIIPQEVPKDAPIQKRDCIVSPLKVLPLSLQDIQHQCAEIKNKLNLGEEEIKNIEQQTRGQSKDELWNFHRCCRITASKCHCIASMKPTTSPTKALSELLHYNKPFQTKQMKEGLLKESEIEELYVKSMRQTGHLSLTVAPNGLCISKSHGFLAATPDGFVYDPHVEPPLGLLEMKYVQVNDDENFVEALIRKRICILSSENNSLKMNTNHKYYYQIHHQMFVTQRQWTDFVVKGSSGDGLFIERVSFACKFWENILPKLCSFFDRYTLPELSYPRVKYGLTRFNLRNE